MRFLETMKLFKYALLILPPTSGVECGFFLKNLLVSPFQKNLNESNLDRLMRININNLKSFTEEETDKLVDLYKNENRRTDL